MTGGEPTKIKWSNETTNRGLVNLIETLEPKIGRLLYIEWYDATSLTDWWDKEELEDKSLLIVASIGIEVSRNDTFLSIAQSVDIKNEVYRNLQMIPVSCIIKEEVIEDE